MVNSHHHPQESNYEKEIVEVETPNGEISTLETFLLRVYPENFNGYDAYMDIPLTQARPTFTIVRSQRLNVKWEVIQGPTESLFRGNFRGDNTSNNPRAWVFGLRKLES